MKGTLRKWTSMGVALLLLLGLTACGAGTGMNTSVSMKAEAPMAAAPMEEMAMDNALSAGAAEPSS
ncbi:MAG: hypothetical protein IKU27_05395, partial [Clostridia bacterium]|nr:hypothetical protein [Clostridia bacterium]